MKAIGLSMGAKTLLHMATQQPERIDAMVLVSATPYFPAPARAAMAQLSVDAFSDAEWARCAQRHVHGDDQIRMLFEQMRGLKDSHDDMAFTPPLLATITARTLIVHGDRDPLYPVELALEMYRSIPASALWVVPERRPRPDLRPARRAVRRDGAERPRQFQLPSPVPSSSARISSCATCLRPSTSIACASRRARVSSLFASVIHSTYSRLWLGLSASKPACAFLFFLNAAARSAGTSAASAARFGARGSLTPASFSATAFLIVAGEHLLRRQIGALRQPAEVPHRVRVPGTADHQRAFPEAERGVLP